jgi:hypothetical protein
MLETAKKCKKFYASSNGFSRIKKEGFQINPGIILIFLTVKGGDEGIEDGVGSGRESREGMSVVWGRGGGEGGVTGTTIKMMTLV